MRWRKYRRQVARWRSIVQCVKSERTVETPSLFGTIIGPLRIARASRAPLERPESRDDCQAAAYTTQYRMRMEILLSHTPELKFCKVLQEISSPAQPKPRMH